MNGRSWTLLVPLKRLSRAKTRLRGALPGVAHERLVLALALDSVEAMVGCPVVRDVIVITADPVAAPALAAVGARVLPDRPEAGLNPALVWAAATLPAATAVAALTADLPALRPADLAEILTRPADLAGPVGPDARPHPAGSADPVAAVPAIPPRWYVPDAAGTGTTALAAARGLPLLPRFGAGSARAHAATGAVALTAAPMSARRDVDTPSDLLAALALGVGERTARLCQGVVRLPRRTGAERAIGR